MNAAAIDDMNAKMDELFAKKETFALVTDARLVTTLPNAGERKALGDWLNRPEQQEQLRRYSAGSSTILTSGLVRGALQAIYWLWTPPNPQHAAADLEGAVDFCFRSLEKRGIAHAQERPAVQAVFGQEIAKWRPRA